MPLKIPMHQKRSTLEHLLKRCANSKLIDLLPCPYSKKLYCTPETDTDLCDYSVESNGNKPETGIIHTKLQQVLRTDPNISLQEALRLLSFSDMEREHVEGTTSKQWQCKKWYLQKASFITASKCKRVITPQETLEKSNAENATKLVKAIALPKAPLYFQIYGKFMGNHSKASLASLSCFR